MEQPQGQEQSERKPEIAKSNVVFEAERIAPEVDTNVFAPFESFVADDELVYPVSL